VAERMGPEPGQRRRAGSVTPASAKSTTPGPTSALSPAIGLTPHHPSLSRRNVHALQRSAGNAAVGRLLDPRTKASDASTGGADKGPSPDTAAPAIEETGRSFGRMAEQSLGLRAGSIAGPDPSNSRAPDRAASTRAAGPSPPDTAQVRAATSQLHQELNTARAAPVGPREPVTRPAETQDAIAPEAHPQAIAAEVAANRAPVGDMTIPMDEAAGPGPESEGALGRLRDVENVHPGLVGFGEAINERIAGLRARATANAARSATDLKAAAATQREAVQEAIRSSHQTVDGVIGATRNRVVQGASSARAALTQRAKAGHERATEATEAQTARVTETVDRGTSDARGVFSAADEEVRTKAEDEAQRGRTHAEDLAQRALALGRDEAGRYRRSDADEDLRERQADAVMDVAQRFAGQLRADGTQLAGDLHEQAGKAREQVGAEAGPAIAGVADVGSGASEGIHTLFGSVDQGVDAVAQQGGQQLDAARDGASGEIDNLNRAAQGRSEALRAGGEASLDVALAAGQVAHAKLAGQASQLVDQTGRDAIDELAGVARAPAAHAVQRQRDGGAGGTATADAGAAPGGLPQSAQADALAPLDQMGPALDQATDNQSAEITGSLRGAGTGASQAGGAWVAETQTNMDRLGGTAETGLRQVVDAADGQVDATVTEGQSRASAEVGRVAGQVDTNVGQIRQSVRGGVDEANRNLAAGAQDGAQHGNETAAQVPGAMREAAEAQDSWLGRVGNWVSNQLADTWQAVKGMCDWRFVASLVVGIAVAVAVGVGVALLIASAPFTLPGLAVVLIVGAAAGAAGFAAAQVTGNLLDPDPNRRWYQGVGHAAILGAFVGAAGMAASFYGLGLAAGTLVVMGAAGVGTVIANVATGRDWDEHLLANILIVGIFHALVKSIGDRIPRRGTGPTAPPTDYGDQPKLPPGTPEIMIDSAARIRATDLVPGPDGLTCDLIDTVSGAKLGSAEVPLTPDGRPAGGPRLDLHPRNSTLPDGSNAILKAPKGFAWTDVAMRAAIDAYTKRFGTGPLNMDGELAWGNLANFQTEFAKIRAENPGLAEGVVAERAVRAISFGKHRVAWGYGNITVQYGNMGDVVINGTTLQNVPQSVQVGARPTTPGVVPILPQHQDDDD
jgi:hypothetical protein